MIDKININQIPDPRRAGDGSSADQPNRTKQVANDKADATLQIDYARLIEQAIQSQQAETDAVQKAKELLQSGQLDNPANIREAAANIIKFGV
jgi:hypothetical protein